MTEPVVPSFLIDRPAMSRRRSGEEAFRFVTPRFHYGQENRLAGFVGSMPIPVLLETAQPLLLIGGSGTGKTALALHLAGRITRDASWQRIVAADEAESDLDAPSETFLHQSAIDFARNFASSIDSHDMPTFRSRLDRLPVWVLEDLQSIAEKIPAQEEVVHRLEARAARGWVTLITCRRWPADVRGQRPGLVSRTLPGLTLALHPPQGPSRMAILRELMIAHQPQMDSGLLRMLEAGLPGDATARDLAAAMKQISLWCRMNDAQPQVQAVQAAISATGQKRALSLKSITAAVARQMNVTSADMRSSSRRQNIVRARGLAMWLSRRLTDESLMQIGDAFGGRDHSTVLHAIRKTEESIAADPTLRRAADVVAEKLAC